MLRISKKLMFAIEAVLDIAYNAGSEPVQSGEITRRQGIPKRYLEQVLQQLVRAGVLAGGRGARGGYPLGGGARAARRLPAGARAAAHQHRRDRPGRPRHGDGNRSRGGTDRLHPWSESGAADLDTIAG